MKNNNLSFKKIILIASLFFGMLFGAGNLIFPVHLGQLSGSNWMVAGAGFLSSAVILPLLALFALSISRSSGIYELAKPTGAIFASIFLILIHITIGPFAATPRTATVPYEIGFAPHLPANMYKTGLLIYTAIFFVIVFLLSVTEAKVTDLIGKVLNPIFIVLLFVIFLLAFIHPLGNSQTAEVTRAYQSTGFTNGFLQGYNTMDALASLIFGITVIMAIKELGVTKQKDVSMTLAKSGLWGMVAIGIIYVCLIWLGATSLHQFKMATNGGTTLAQISYYYMGVFGNVLLATLTTITCITTAMGLVIAFAQDFHERFPKVSYKTFLSINCLISFAFANLGLDKIIIWSTPVLMFLYPIAISLILLGILSPIFKNDKIVYKVTCYLTLIPAIFDLLNALPPVLRNTEFVQVLIKFAEKFFPLFSIGFSWTLFSLTGLVIGLLIHFLKRNNKIIS